MKHDYMTDRNWKFDEDQAPALKNKSAHTIIYSLLIFLIILALSLFAWHYYKKRHIEIMAKHTVIQTTPISHPQMQSTPETEVASSSATTSVSKAPSTSVQS